MGATKTVELDCHSQWVPRTNRRARHYGLTPRADFDRIRAKAEYQSRSTITELGLLWDFWLHRSCLVKMIPSAGHKSNNELWIRRHMHFDSLRTVPFRFAGNITTVVLAFRCAPLRNWNSSLGIIAYYDNSRRRWSHILPAPVKMISFTVPRLYKFLPLASKSLDFVFLENLPHQWEPTHTILNPSP